jgi:hypothetical protein
MPGCPNSGAVSRYGVREIVKLAHPRAGSLTVSRGDTVRVERDGVGLDLWFTDVPGRLYRGRVIRTFP